MNKTNTFLAIASGVLIGTTAFAQSTTSYSDGDILLGFRATDTSSAYVVNLGQALPFYSNSQGNSFVLNYIGGIGNDLSNIFGANWATRIDPATGTGAVLFSFIGTSRTPSFGLPQYTIFSSNPDSANPFGRSPVAALALVSNLVAAEGNFFAGNLRTANSAYATIQNANDTNGYASFQPGGIGPDGQARTISYDYFDPTNESAVAISSVLFLNEILPGSGPSRQLGSFVLAANGALIYTQSISAIPEPSTYLAGGLALVAVGSFLRRRRPAQA